MKYIIQKKQNKRTNYSSSAVFIKIVDKHQTYTTEFNEATRFHKGSLKRWYRIYGRENLIIHKVKP